MYQVTETAWSGIRERLGPPELSSFPPPEAASGRPDDLRPPVPFA